MQNTKLYIGTRGGPPNYKDTYYSEVIVSILLTLSVSDATAAQRI